MEISGIIKAVNPTQQVSASFSKRELIITSEEQYPQYIMVEFTQDKCALLDRYKVGDAVVVGINLRGREWINPQGEAKYFNSIQGWKINHQEAPQQAPTLAPVHQATPYTPDPAYQEEDHDDLPF